MAKAKKKPEKIERRFVVGLQPVYNYPKPRRTNKAIGFLKRFVFKHFRVPAENVFISNTVNEFIWQFGRENIPRKIEIRVVVLAGKANVYLKGEKVKVEKEEKKEKEKPEKKTEEEKAAEEEKEKKKDEKKLAERSAEKAALKRGKE